MTRMLAQARPVAVAIANGLKLDDYNPVVVARDTYMAAWPATARSQRSFHVFGGEFLMKQDVEILRGFFMALFKVSSSLFPLSHFRKNTKRNFESRLVLQLWVQPLKRHRFLFSQIPQTSWSAFLSGYPCLPHVDEYQVCMPLYLQHKVPEYIFFFCLNVSARVSL